MDSQNIDHYVGGVRAVVDLEFTSESRGCQIYVG